MGIAPINFGMPNVIDLFGLNETNDFRAYLQSLISVNWIDREDIDPDFSTQDDNHLQINFTLEELVDIDSDDDSD